jgi:hypothetical protein
VTFLVPETAFPPPPTWTSRLPFWALRVWNRLRRRFPPPPVQMARNDARLEHIVNQALRAAARQESAQRRASERAYAEAPPWIRREQYRRAARAREGEA